MLYMIESTISAISHQNAHPISSHTKRKNRFEKNTITRSTCSTILNTNHTPQRPQTQLPNHRHDQCHWRNLRPPRPPIPTHPRRRNPPHNVQIGPRDHQIRNPLDLQIHRQPRHILQLLNPRPFRTNEQQLLEIRRNAYCTVQREDARCDPRGVCGGFDIAECGYLY